MADELRLYVVCPTCNGTGVVQWGTAPCEPGPRECPTCKDARGDLAPVVFDDLRHIYVGRIQEIDDE
jgi:hypothetical protein